MKALNKYTLYLLSAYALGVAVWAALCWNALTLMQQIMVFATAIVTLHEWEEQRFPGGFMQVMGGIMELDVSRLDLHALQSKPDIFIFVLTGAALLFRDLPFFGIAVIILGLFEGFIHIMGIRLGRLSRPYTPGMVTAELYALCSVIGIALLVRDGVTTGTDWLIGLVWYLIAFLCLEAAVWGSAGLKPKELIAKMKARLAQLK